MYTLSYSRVRTSASTHAPFFLLTLSIVLLHDGPLSLSLSC